MDRFNIMSGKQEQQLVDSMYEATAHMNAGDTPNDAITKVAKERGFGPELIARVVEGINKSLSVATMKNASEDTRANNFELADTVSVVRNIFTEHMPKVAHTLSLPTKDFSSLGISESITTQKTASQNVDEPEKMYIHTALDQMKKHAAFFEKTEEVLNQKVAEARHSLMGNIEDTITALRPLSKHWLKKIAQNVVNKYPESHGAIFDILRAEGRLDIPELQKTSSHCIFPEVEPYLTINKLYTSARELNLLTDEVSRFKEAALSSGTALSSALGGAATSALGLGALSRMQERAGSVQEPALKYIDPEVLNRLKEMEARRNLMEIVLYDPEMKAYPFANLVRAYNDSVSSVNDAYKHPNVLKNLMLQRLEGGDVKDVATIKQETEVAKNLRNLSDDSTTSAKEIMGA